MAAMPDGKTEGIDVPAQAQARAVSDFARVYKEAVERHRASFVVIAFAIFYAGHGQDNYKIFKTHLAPED